MRRPRPAVFSATAALATAFLLLAVDGTATATDTPAAPQPDCPAPPSCPPHEPPLLSAQDELVVRIYSHEDGTSSPGQLRSQVCQLVREFDGLVKLDLKVGAKAKKVNGALTCGVNCFGDRWQACLGLWDGGYFSSCDEPKVRISDIQYCMEYDKSDFIIVSNGEERKQLGIPECQIPTLTFNDTYDPCVPLANYAQLKHYVCRMLGFGVSPCMPDP